MVAPVATSTYSSEATSATSHNVPLPSWTKAARQRVFVAVGAYPGSDATQVASAASGSPFTKLADSVNTNFGAQVSLFWAEATDVTPGQSYAFTYPTSKNRVEAVVTVLPNCYGTGADMKVQAGTGTTNGTTGVFPAQSITALTWGESEGHVLTAHGHVGPNTGATPLAVAKSGTTTWDFLTQRSSTQTSGRNFLVFQTSEDFSTYMVDRNHTFTAGGAVAGNPYSGIAVIIPSTATFIPSAETEPGVTRTLDWSGTVGDGVTLSVVPPSGVTLSTPSGEPLKRTFVDDVTRKTDLAFDWTLTDASAQTRSGTLVVPGYGATGVAEGQFTWDAATSGWVAR